MSFFSNYDYECNELRDCLTNDWQMKVRFADAFLATYRKSIGKLYVKGRKRLAKLENHPDPAVRVAFYAQGGEDSARDYALVGQAYNAYMRDLRKGRHVGTDVEKAIWAILANRSDLLEELDRGLARFIDKHEETKFPDLFDEVFEAAD